ncbi:MAG: hypothetical protein ACPGVX_09040, partial [Thalassobaculaceae bacterium]
MAVTMPRHTALRPRLRDAKIKGMVDQIGIAVFGNLAAAGTLALLIWDKTDSRPVIAWIVAIFLLTALRIHFHHRLMAQFRAGQSPAGWAHGLVFLLICSGLVWGSLSLVVLEPARSFQVAAVVSVTIGVIAGALGSLATYRPAFWGFSLAAILPLVGKFLSLGAVIPPAPAP